MATTRKAARLIHICKPHITILMVEDDETQEKENGNFQETNELLCGKLTDKKYKSNHLND